MEEKTKPGSSKIQIYGRGQLGAEVESNHLKLESDFQMNVSTLLPTYTKSILLPFSLQCVLTLPPTKRMKYSGSSSKTDATRAPVMQ